MKNKMLNKIKSPAKGGHGTSGGKNKKGFTIIELVVVVIIIATLAAIAFVSYESSRKQARDARRLADMTNIESTLRMHYLKNTAFPDTLANLVADGYFQKLPQTPAATPTDYDYDINYVPDFVLLHTTLEDSNNMPSTNYTGTATDFTCDGDAADSLNFCLKVAP